MIHAGFMLNRVYDFQCLDMYCFWFDVFKLLHGIIIDMKRVHSRPMLFRRFSFECIQQLSVI